MFNSVPSHHFVVAYLSGRARVCVASSGWARMSVAISGLTTEGVRATVASTVPVTSAVPSLPPPEFLAPRTGVVSEYHTRLRTLSTLIGESGPFPSVLAQLICGYLIARV